MPEAAAVPASPQHWMTTEEAAMQIGCSRRQAGRLAESGALRAEKASGSWLIDPTSVQQYLDDRSDT